MTARILLIEDNPANLDLMSYLLKAFGYSVLAAVDGEEGLATARREKPDLIICDVQLPKMDGLEVARYLKSDPVLRMVPLIAVTAFAMVGDRDRMLAAGFDGYMAKPINPETFVRQLEAYLPQQRHAVAPETPEINTPSSALPDVHHSILVVDNLPVNLDLARSILEPHGYHIVTADGMAQALELARQLPPDLILSDVCMAEGSGYDFIRAVKADRQLCAIPFMFITSTMLDEIDRAKGLTLGAARFLMRPIEPTALLAEIESCLAEQEKGQ